MVAGASANEIGLVLFLLAIVLLATKAGTIGEFVAGLFSSRAPSDAAHQTTTEEQEDHRNG